MGCWPAVGGTVAVWNQAQFTGRYPEFTTAVNANPTLFASLFVEAGLYLNNTPSSPVCNVTTRLLFLNMLVAHIAFVSGTLTADGQPKPVGRVSQAAEGSVSVSLESQPPTPGSPAWFQQSQYGSAFWQATANYRGFQYRSRRTRVW